MRLLIYGMQSSGASTLALLLAQKPDCSAFVDIWTMYVAPALPADHAVVAKVVVTTAFPLALHQERFRPDRTILFLRHPQVNYRSLASKGYRNHCGFMEEKFAVLDRVFAAKAAYDAVFYYEDLVLDPAGTAAAITRLGWSCEPDFLRFPRKHREIIDLNNARYPGIADRLEYGMGNHRPGGVLCGLSGLEDLSTAIPGMDAWCPMVLEHYRELLGQSGQNRWSALQKTERGGNPQ